MKQTTIVAIVLGVLVIVSAVQSFQLSKLKEKIAGGTEAKPADGEKKAA